MADVEPLITEGVAGLDLPLGRRVELPGRGTTFVRDVAGPTPDAPVVVLLHGWFASGGLNWHQAFRPLSQHFRVIAPDLRGHGRGIKAWRRFRLSDPRSWPATRWAVRWASCSGGGIPTRSRAW